MIKQNQQGDTMKKRVLAEIMAKVLIMHVPPSSTAGIKDSHRQPTQLGLKHSPRPPWGEAYCLEEGQYTLEEEDEEEGHEVEWAISPVDMRGKKGKCER